MIVKAGTRNSFLAFPLYVRYNVRMNKCITATEARKRFYDVIDAAEHPGVSVVITHEGIPKVVVMSFEEYEGWQETFDIMSDPILSKELVKALKNRKKEKGIPWEKVKKDLKL